MQPVRQAARKASGISAFINGDTTHHLLSQKPGRPRDILETPSLAHPHQSITKSYQSYPDISLESIYFLPLPQPPSTPTSTCFPDNWMTSYLVSCSHSCLLLIEYPYWGQKDLFKNANMTISQLFKTLYRLPIVPCSHPHVPPSASPLLSRLVEAAGSIPATDP